MALGSNGFSLAQPDMDEPLQNSDPSEDASDLERAMFGWMLDHNLSYLVKFHNVVRALFSEKINDADAGLDSGAKHTLRLYQEVNAANALLLLIGYVEEMLFLLWQRTWPVQAPDPRTTIDRYKPLFVEAGIDIGAFTSWAILKDAVRVRHCIMHANGRLSLLRDPEDMRRCLERYPGDLRLISDRIVVTPQFLRTCVEATRQTRDALILGLDRYAS
jgi:hypothetical protein